MSFIRSQQLLKDQNALVSFHGEDKAGGPSCLLFFSSLFNDFSRSLQHNSSLPVAKQKPVTESYFTEQSDLLIYSFATALDVISQPYDVPRKDYNCFVLFFLMATL